MKILRILLPLLVFLIWNTAAKAQYNPTDPPEPGVYFALTARAVPADGGYSISGAGTHAFGTNVSMRVSTNTGYRFVCWEDEEGTVVSTTQNFTYVMPARNVSLIARFEYDPSSPSEPSTPEFKDVSYISFKMNPSDGGSLSSGSAKEYEVGSTQRFTVRANSNFRFVNWTCEDIELGTSSTLEYTVPKGDRILVANFAFDPTSPSEPSVPDFPRTLTLKTNPSGAATVSGGGSHTVGSSFTVSATSNTYYQFLNWTDEEGNVVSEASRFTYTMPDRHVTLTANYTYDYNPSSPDEPGTPNPGSGMAENMVLWPRFGMYDDSHVQILCETPGATIHYTLDGSTPNASSQVYTQPIYVGSNLLVRAIAYKEGMEDSPVVNYRVTAYKTATPVFTFENLLLKITSETPGAIIRYTTDFTNPNEESEVYTAPFLPEENCRIKAYASKEGLADSPINIFVFRSADYTIPAPTLSLNGKREVVITPSVEGGETRYTLDGSDPTLESPLYTAPLSLEGTVTVRAYTTHPNYYDSPIGEFVFVYSDYQVAKPIATYDELTRLVTMSCETEDASIRYTTTGDTPTATTGTSYSEPFVVEGNKTFMVRAFRNDLFDSEVTILEVNYQKVPTPTASFANRLLTLTCEDADAAIRYTVDGSEPTASSSPYTTPIALTEDCTVKFIAVREYFLDSEIGTYEFKVSDHQVATPELTYDPASKTLTMECHTGNAEIRYTIDGKVPTESTGIKYEEPFEVWGNHTFISRAFRSDLFPSETVSVEINDQKVASPVVTHSLATMKVTMTCATVGAQIRYTIDGSVPTADTGTLYTEPIDIKGNMTFTVRAFLTDFLDSEVTIYSVSDMKLPTPTASYAKHAVTLECAEPGAEIRYAIGNVEGYSLYESPLPMADDCTIQFYATKSGYNDSDEGSFRFNLSEWQDTIPLIYKDFRHRKIFVKRESSNGIRVIIDGDERICNSLDSIDVTPDMKFLQVTALASGEDRYDSKTVSDTIVFHLPPEILFNGYEVQFTAHPDDPMKDGAERWITVCRDSYYPDPFPVRDDIAIPVEDFGQAVAYMESDMAFRSDVSWIPIDYFTTGYKVGVRRGHRIADVFHIVNLLPEEVDNLTVVGEINREDLEFLSYLPRLTDLTLEPYVMMDDCESVFAGSRIETLRGYSLPHGILKNMPRLTTVVWTEYYDSAIPEGLISESGNPNLLLWVKNPVQAPSDALNVVVKDSYASNAGTAERITLTPGYPFGAHYPIDIKEISLTKEFTLPTVIGECAGWESLVLPFDPENIVHENGDLLVPFSAWGGPEDPKKPFWLYRATENGWVAADEIEAGIPYIISMPNNEEYVDGYSLPGKVTFSAHDVTVGPGTQAKTSKWKDGIEFVGSFMPVEETGIRSLNVNETAGRNWLGSAFVGEDVTLPFGAYMRSGNMPSQIPVFGDWSGVLTPTVDTNCGIMVETPYPGAIRISTMRDCRTDILTPDGAKVHSLSLKAGESVTVDGLTRGLYICAGKKTMVK